MRCRAKSNQGSPLLRLPPEIRNKIWEYTLGHNIFKPVRVRVSIQKFKSKWISRPDEPQIGLALLATCRQIYSEAAFMPFNLNTFAADTFSRESNFVKAFKAFKVHQRRQITSIRPSACTDYACLGLDGLEKWDEYHLERYRAQFKRLLPKLNTIVCHTHGRGGILVKS
jgi:hypothetical protein